MGQSEKARVAPGSLPPPEAAPGQVRAQPALKASELPVSQRRLKVPWVGLKRPFLGALCCVHRTRTRPGQGLGSPWGLRVIMEVSLAGSQGPSPTPSSFA